MNTLIQQFKFDFRREILRNFPFLFFSLLMPAGFYLLFTRVMVTGTKQEMVQFAGSYMGSMIVYSLIVSAFFGLASMLQRDRKSGYVARLVQTPRGAWPYYLSVAFCFAIITILALGLMMGLAVGVNHVNLNAVQVSWILVAAIAGELPFLLIGLLISRVHREETLSIISNLLTFPVAIVSGLWWPLSMLPQWVQHIGKLTPTYRLDHIINNLVDNNSVSGYDVAVIGAWVAVSVGLVYFISHISGWWKHGVSKAKLDESH